MRKYEGPATTGPPRPLDQILAANKPGAVGAS